MKNSAKQSVLYALVFCLGYLIACGSGGVSKNLITSPVLQGSAALRMLTSAVHPTAIFSPTAPNQPVIASLSGAVAKATINNPSQLGQSFETTCGMYTTGPNSTGTRMHFVLGNSGFVPLNYLGGNFCGPALASIGVDENGVPQGFPAIYNGTINTLVVWGRLAGGGAIECVDSTNVATIADGTLTRAYYDLSNDTVVLGSGTTQLPLSCHISVGPGDDVTSITVQWLKT